MESNQRIDYLYKEYARLNEKIEEHIKGSFEDFKLLGAASASIILWKPIVDVIVLVNSKIDYGRLLFIGFLSLLLIFVLIGYINLIRSAVMFSMFSSLLSFEKEIRRELAETEDSQVFTFVHERDTVKFSTAWRLTYGNTLILLATAITFIPFIILYSSNFLFAGIYLFLALLAIGSYIRVSRKLVKLFFSKLRIF